MENCCQRSPIKLTTLKEARDIHRSKSNLGCQNLAEDANQYSSEKSLTSIRCNVRVSDSAKRIHTKSIEGNKNLIEKAFAVKLAFSSPVKDKKTESSTSPNKVTERKTSRSKTSCQPGYLQRLLSLQKQCDGSEKKGKETEGKQCKSEVICFIKGLEKLRYKLLKS